MYAFQCQASKYPTSAWGYLRRQCFHISNYSNSILVFQSDLYTLEDGLVIRNPDRSKPENPSVDLSAEFKKVIFVQNQPSRSIGLRKSNLVFLAFHRLETFWRGSKLFQAFCTWIVWRLLEMSGLAVVSFSRCVICLILFASIHKKLFVRANELKRATPLPALYSVKSCYKGVR